MCIKISNPESANCSGYTCSFMYIYKRTTNLWKCACKFTSRNKLHENSDRYFFFQIDPHMKVQRETCLQVKDEKRRTKIKLQTCDVICERSDARFSNHTVTLLDDVLYIWHLMAFPAGSPARLRSAGGNWKCSTMDSTWLIVLRNSWCLVFKKNPMSAVENFLHVKKIKRKRNVILSSCVVTIKGSFFIWTY